MILRAEQDLQKNQTQQIQILAGKKSQDICWKV